MSEAASRRSVESWSVVRQCASFLLTLALLGVVGVLLGLVVGHGLAALADAALATLVASAGAA